MANLLLPQWFDPWGWIVVGVAAIIVLVCILILILKSGKKENGGKNKSANAKQEKAREEKPVEKKAEPVKEKAYEEKKAETKPASKPAEKKAEAKPASKPVEKTTDDKPATKTYHISKRKEDNRWQVKAAGGSKALKLFNTQAEAIEYAKETAKNQDARIVIHKEDGSFRRLTY